MFEPSGNILPSIVNFPLLTFETNSFSASGVLPLDDAFALVMFTLQGLGILTSHSDHLKGLLILSLTPLTESFSAGATPEHSAQPIAELVLISRKLLVTGELSDILEAALPH